MILDVSPTMWWGIFSITAETQGSFLESQRSSVETYVYNNHSIWGALCYIMCNTINNIIKILSRKVMHFMQEHLLQTFNEKRVVVELSSGFVRFLQGRESRYWAWLRAYLSWSCDVCYSTQHVALGLYWYSPLIPQKIKFHFIEFYFGPVSIVLLLSCLRNSISKEDMNRIQRFQHSVFRPIFSPRSWRN